MHNQRVGPFDYYRWTHIRCIMSANYPTEIDEFRVMTIKERWSDVDTTGQLARHDTWRSK